MTAPKPKRGNRGGVHRDEVARREAASGGRAGRGRAGATDGRGRSGRDGGARVGGARVAGGAGRGSGAQPGRRGVGGAGGGGGVPRELGGEQVEGRRAVRELLAAGRRRAREVWMAEGLDESPLLAEIADLANDRRVVVRRVSRARLAAEARTDAPQGVIAYAEPLPEMDLDDLLRPRGDVNPFLVCIDGVTDPHNLGAILRSAEVAGATGAVLPRHRSAHVTPTVAKAAAGAIERLPIAVVAGLAGAMTACTAAGVWTVGLAAEGSVCLFDLELATEPVAVVLGAEGSGLSRLVRQRCDVLASIPQRGSINSLNVAAAGAIACFEVNRRRAK